MIKGHGDDRFSFEKTIVADFSSNVWFGGPSAELIAHLKQNLQLIAHYPEPDAAGLCAKIAEVQDVKPDQVLAFNGSVEAFYTIALAYRQSVSAILYPAFSEYEDACLMHEHRLQFFKKGDWQASLKTKPDLFWIGNPNNPDAQIFHFQELKEAIEKHSDTVFLIDEAYADFYPEFQSAIALTKTQPNLIVVRSLTKCCAIPGLRLGYLVVSPGLAPKIKCFMQPWSVNALAQAAGSFLLKSDNLLDVKQIASLSNDLQNEISRISGFRVLPSKASFFLIEMQAGKASDLKKYLLDEHGILIRDATNFRGLNERHFRISTRDKPDNHLFIQALKHWQRAMTT